MSKPLLRLSILFVSALFFTLNLAYADCRYLYEHDAKKAPKQNDSALAALFLGVSSLMNPFGYLGVAEIVAHSDRTKQRLAWFASNGLTLSIINEAMAHTPGPSTQLLYDQILAAEPQFDLSIEEVLHFIFKANSENYLCKDGRNQMLFADLKNRLLNKNLLAGDRPVFRNLIGVHIVLERDKNNSIIEASQVKKPKYGRTEEAIKPSRSYIYDGPWIEDANLSRIEEIRDQQYCFAMCADKESPHANDVKLVTAFGANPEEALDKAAVECSQIRSNGQLYSRIQEKKYLFGISDKVFNKAEVRYSCINTELEKLPNDPGQPFIFRFSSPNYSQDFFLE